MREIKFRAWDKNYGEMIDWISLQTNRISYEDQFGLFQNNEYIFMQFTGLKEKNGKEIYESDYLEDDWCVFWGSGKYILHNISTGDIIDCNEQNTQTKSITGNRYESPREHKAMETDL